jgi:hypothetical protein
MVLDVSNPVGLYVPLLEINQSAKSVIAGIELMHMIRKGQLINGYGYGYGCGKASFADQFYALAK